MMNLKKVKKFIDNKLEEYRHYYESDGLFNNLKVDVYGGSFGRCFVSISNDYFSLNNRYCGNYADIEGFVSEFFARGYDRVASQIYYEHKQEQKAHPMSATLTVYQDNKQVNFLEFPTLEKVKTELLKIFIAKEKRGVKTRIKFKPYSDNLTIVQTFPKETNGTQYNYEYCYEFKGVNY